jgi:hypothetical protein
MASRRKVEHTFYRMEDQSIYCSRCGESSRIAFPISVSDLLRKTKGFNMLHADCIAPTAAAPEPPADRGGGGT